MYALYFKSLYGININKYDFSTHPIIGSTKINIDNLIIRSVFVNKDKENVHQIKIFDDHCE